MFMDRNTTFSGTRVVATGALLGQVVASGSPVVSTDSYDSGPLVIGGNQPTDFGMGEIAEVSVSVLVTPVGGTAMQFAIIQADDAALTVNVQVLAATAAIPIANLTAGVNVQLPFRSANPLPPKRFIGVQYIPTGVFTAGSYFAGAVAKVGTRVPFYKSGFAVT